MAVSGRSLVSSSKFTVLSSHNDSCYSLEGAYALGNPSKDLLATEGALRAVIETLIDGQEGFRQIGEAVSDGELKRYFLEESLQRAAFRGELENILHQEGVKDVKETGRPEGTFLRLFTGLKAAFGAGPHALLQAADESEDQTVRAYHDALENFLPAPVRDVLLQQAAHIEACAERVKAAREASSE